MKEIELTSEAAHYFTPLRVMVGISEEHLGQVFIGIVDVKQMSVETKAAVRITPEMARFIAKTLIAEADAAEAHR